MSITVAIDVRVAVGSYNCIINIGDMLIEERKGLVG